MSTALQSTARTQPLVTIAVVGATVEVILTATLAIPLNVTGSATARLGMILITLLVTYWYTRGEWWPSLDRVQLAKCLALSFAVAAALFGVDSIILTRFTLNPLIKLLLDAVVFLIIYLVGLIILKPLQEEDIEMIRTAIPVRLHGLLSYIQRTIVRNEIPSER